MQLEEKRNSTKSHSKFADKKNSIINPLDSNPAVKRGKEREKPKPKKPSTLKKIILKEREEKRRIRQPKISTSKLSLCSGDSSNKKEDEEDNEVDTNNENEKYDDKESLLINSY